MRIPTLLSGLALVTAGAVLGRALPQDDAAVQDPSQPGPMHEAMTSRAGKYTVKTSMGGQDLDEGAAELTSVLGGRYLLEENSGTMMGQPYEGLRLWGFNNETQELESVWVYTQSTGMLTMTGKMSEDEESFACEASYVEGGETREMDITLSFPSDTSHAIEMGGTGPDGTRWVYKETYTKKK